MNESNQLLRDYAEKGSEAAFRELVERYIDLVYSVAVRRAAGDAHRAEDIVQTVFTDLARKAPDLPPNVQLGGWLHRHCCFVASTVHRTETRRLARERQAMDLLNSEGPGESSWQDLAPVLDEAIQELQEPDREALVLRYFEKRDLRSVGQALGTNEDAAQKRVSRALDKLRGLLAARGVALSITALTAHLASSSISAAPAGWAAKIGSQALEHVALSTAKIAATSGILAIFLGSSALKIGALVTAIAFFVGALIWKGNYRTQLAANTNAASTAAQSPSSTVLPTASASLAAPDLATLSTPDTDDTNALRIVLISKDSGQPVPNGRIDYRAWEGDKFSSRKLATDDSGVCATIISRDSLTDLELTTRIDGFADTRLKWWPKRGDKIPSSYTVKLERAVPIGGRVVDESGNPVDGAKVGFNHDENPVESMQTESHLFSWIEVQTDSDGRWKIDRIAGPWIRQLRGGANHPDYVDSSYLQVGDKPGAEAELRAATHVFTLGAGATVRGVVLDESGLAIPNAKILVGQLGWAGARKTTTELNGTFEVKGCKPGKSMITAEAQQYSAATIPVDISLASSEPYQIVLKAGKILRLRVVNRAGQPVPRAHVWLNTMDSERLGGGQPLVQAEFAPRTDDDGRVVWDQAPDRELTFDIQGMGYMRAQGVKVMPDGTEHVVTLQPALKITGTVVDSKSGEPIPKFKVIAGWPDRIHPDDESPRGHWSPLDRHWLTFADGKFEYLWDEPVIYGRGDIEYIFKFEAEGYSSYVTRVVNAKEETAHFDVRLEPAKATMITVLRPGGSPAANTDVALAGPNQYLEVNASGFARRDGVVLTTDAQGQFSFNPDETVVTVFAANSEGFSAMTPSAVLEKGVMQLQPWGRVEGTFTKRGQAVKDKKITLDPHPLADNRPGVRTASNVSTDAQGRFSISAVPPGNFNLSTLAPVEEHGGGFMHVPLETIEVRPGETTVVNYDENGAEVRVRLHWPADFKRNPKQQIMALMHTAFPQPPREILNNRDALMAWQASPEIQELARKAKHIQLREREGVWVGEDVRPGNYMLSFAVMDPTEASGHMAPLLTANNQVAIAENPEETVDLGVIALAPPATEPNAQAN